MKKLREGVAPGYASYVTKRNDELALKHGAIRVFEIPLIVTYTFPTPEQRNAFEQEVISSK